MRLPILVAVTLALLVPPAAQADEGDAVKAVEMLGGRVIRDDKQTDKPVISVTFRGPQAAQVTDAALKEIKAFKGLRSLSLMETKVTDEGLKELKDFDQLEHLNCHKTRLTGAGLKDLKGLAKLATLHLTETGLTDEGMKSLKELKQVTKLWLDGSKFPRVRPVIDV